MLKHRKRREKTVRKLDAMQANLNRLTDLTGEIRRQLGPLGRQAAVARRAAGVQADLRDAKMRLLADDLAQITAKIAQEAVDEQAAIDHRNRVQRRAGRRRPREQETAEATLREATPALQQAQDTWFALSALAERMRGHHRAGRRAGQEPGRAGPGRRHRPGPRRTRGGRRPGRGRAGRPAGDGRGRRRRVGQRHRASAVECERGAAGRRERNWSPRTG